MCLSISQENNFLKNDDNYTYLGSGDLTDFYFRESSGEETVLVAKFGDENHHNYTMPESLAKHLVENNEIEEDSVFAQCYKNYLNYIKQNG